MENPDDLALIHKFLDEELSPDELAEVKKRISSDPVFARELRAYTDILIGLKAANRVRDKIVIKEKNRWYSSLVTIFSIQKRTMTLMVLLLILLGGGIFSWHLYSTSGTGIYGRYYETPDGYSGYRGKLENLTSIPSEPDDLFYYGIKNMENKTFGVAIRSFEQIIREKDNLYLDDAKWYLSLCYLRIDKKALAIRLLEEIRASNNKNSADAASILQILLKK